MSLNQFKFFQKEERVFTDYMDAMDDYFLGGIPLATHVQRGQRREVPIPERNYDSKVINIVRTRMRERLSWRGYETNVCEPDGYPLLKIVSGINVGGNLQILYLVTRNNDTKSYRVSVPLVNLQRRG
jgi:hypothetical protein